MIRQTVYGVPIPTRKSLHPIFDIAEPTYRPDQTKVVRRRRDLRCLVQVTICGQVSMATYH
jgi:hypothetical protein